MKYVKLILLFAIIVVLLIFVLDNADQKITLKFFGTTVENLEMIIALLITFLIGMVVGFFISALQVFAVNSKMRALNADYKKLKQEVDVLRNKDLEEPEEVE
ncbi:MAG: LapA family protein [Candidatus Neomarinimicrobiota bacterium]